MECIYTGIFDKLFKRSEKKRQVLQHNIDIAKQEDMALWDEWNHTHQIAKRVLAKDVDAYFEVIDEFGPLDDLVEFGSGFEFGTDTGEEIHVSFDVNVEQVIPEKALILTKTGKLSEKALTKTLYYVLYQDYVCNCALRIARDMFALLPVTVVYVHSFEERMNTVTVHREKIVILSVKYNRKTIEQLNYEHLDPSDALANFQHQMIFKKTKGFDEVEIIQS